MSQGGLLSLDSTKIYYMGIIDIFTLYTAKKRGEHFLKSLKYDSQGISCIPPHLYSKRFQVFIETTF